MAMERRNRLIARCSGPRPWTPEGAPYCREGQRLPAAPRMTCALVTRCPWVSQMNPEPWPCSGAGQGIAHGPASACMHSHAARSPAEVPACEERQAVHGHYGTIGTACHPWSPEPWLECGELPRMPQRHVGGSGARRGVVGGGAFSKQQGPQAAANTSSRGASKPEGCAGCRC